jgi:hypothetical protein
MKIITTILLMFPLVATACSGYVIAFKGLNNAFDNEALSVYANRIAYCSKSFSWDREKDAIKFIETLNVPYQLYGFSRGAQTVSTVLSAVKVKPEYVITIGAYKTANVNFDKHNVRYNNFFDQSGVGQKSPGMYLNVPHNMIQKEVNKILHR